MIIPNPFYLKKKKATTELEIKMYDLLAIIYKKQTGKNLEVEIYKVDNNACDILGVTITAYLLLKTQLIQFINCESIKLIQVDQNKDTYRFIMVRDNNIIDDTVVSESCAFSFSSQDDRVKVYQEFFMKTLEDLSLDNEFKVAIDEESKKKLESK